MERAIIDCVQRPDTNLPWIAAYLFDDETAMGGAFEAFVATATDSELLVAVRFFVNVAITPEQALQLGRMAVTTELSSPKGASSERDGIDLRPSDFEPADLAWVCAARSFGNYQAFSQVPYVAMLSGAATILFSQISPLRISSPRRL